MDRGSIVAALTLVACACFYDHAPKSDGTTTQAASTGSTAAPTTGPGTTGGTTLADGASEATSGAVDATTGPAPDDTTAAIDPSTTQPMPTTTGEATTGDVGACSGLGPLACYQCCAAAEPGSQVFFAGLAECTCTMGSPCLAGCTDTLCKALQPDDACLTCVAGMLDMACLDKANTACQASPECGAFTACIVASNCGP